MMIDVRKLTTCLGLMLALGCSGEPGEFADEPAAESDELEAAEEEQELGTLDQAFTEAACATIAPDRVVSLFGASDSESDASPASYGIAQCTQARRISVFVNGVVNSRITVQPTNFPSVANCTNTSVAARVFRNGVLQRNFAAKFGVLSGGICQRPSHSAIFPMGDGADWRVIVQSRLGANTISVTTLFNNQQQ